MKIRKRSKASCVGVLSGVAALSLLAMAMVFPEVDGAFAADPTCKESQNAEGDLPVCEQKTGNIGVNFEVKELAEGGGNPDGIELKTGNLNVNFTVNPYIQLDMANPNITTTAVMSNGSADVKGSTPFSVRTNSSSGFDVYVTATDALLKASGISGEDKVISPLTDKSALGGFAANSWGYSVTKQDEDATTYYGVITNQGNSAYDKQHTFSKDPTNLQLNFGAKVSDTLPSGTYQTTVTISAVISSAEIPNIP